MTDENPADTADSVTNEENTENNGFYTHENWETGQPCPECRCERMSVVQVSTETYKHSRGDIEYLDHGAYREDLKVECQDCNELLLRHPAMGSLNAV